MVLSFARAHLHMPTFVLVQGLRILPEMLCGEAQE